MIPELRRFQLMPHPEQAATVRRLAALGWVAQEISRATGLEVELIRRALAEGAGRAVHV